MIKKTLGLLALSACFTATASADPRFYAHGDVSYNDLELENTAGFTAGGGLELTENFEIEVGYSEMGSVDDNSGPIKESYDITSAYISANVGGHITEDIKLFGILGHERFDIDDRFGNFNESDEFIGAGVSYSFNKNLSLRVRYISHASGDIKSVNAGVAYYF